MDLEINTHTHSQETESRTFEEMAENSAGGRAKRETSVSIAERYSSFNEPPRVWAKFAQYPRVTALVGCSHTGRLIFNTEVL